MWEAGLKHGLGAYAWSNGNTYNGEFKQDMPWGRGTFTLKGGHLLYEG